MDTSYDKVSNAVLQAENPMSDAPMEDDPCLEAAEAQGCDCAPSPEALSIPKGQRGKRSTRKRSASLLWGSPGANASSEPDHGAASALRAKGAASAAKVCPGNQLDNDEAIARALAGMIP